MLVAESGRNGYSSAPCVHSYRSGDATVWFEEGAFINILFTSSLLIEVIFSLDGLGLLGFEAALGRDYPVVFGSLYIFTLIGLLLRLISDLTYVLIDPRIDFERRSE